MEDLAIGPVQKMQSRLDRMGSVVVGPGSFDDFVESIECTGEKALMLRGYDPAKRPDRVQSNVHLWPVRQIECFLGGYGRVGCESRMAVMASAWFIEFRQRLPWLLHVD